MKKFWLLRGIKIAAFVVVAVLAIGFVVMSLWNCLLPTLFGFPMITFWQALGILILSKILFGGFKKGHHHCSNCGHGPGGWKRHGGWKQHMKERLEAKMAKMSPEEKEKLKQKLKRHCGFWEDDEKKEEKTDENLSKE
ncbi:MAG TPA: hypothetical protein VNB90_01565 [Cytophagaceae bacterium]|jgi:hypothetical protein|nr:hypothetical protein [Cytophagaceae bacterium]